MAVAPVASLTAPIMYGATNPERLPIDVISANPVAAVAPFKNAVGRFQNSGMVVTIPAMATISAPNDHQGSACQTTLSARLTPPSRPAAARWPRRSPVRSEFQASASMVTTAAA
ncbi:hypothetical protein D9M70_584560 [compost metagenome]